MAKLLKTNYQDEIKAQGVVKRQYKMVDVLTGALLNNGNPIALNRSDIPSQEGSKIGSTDMNDITKAVNMLLGSGWGDIGVPYCADCLKVGKDENNGLQYYNVDSINRPSNSTAGFVMKLALPSNIYSVVAFGVAPSNEIYKVDWSITNNAWGTWEKNTTTRVFEFEINKISDYLNAHIISANEAIDNLTKSVERMMQNVDYIWIRSVIVNPAGNKYFDIPTVGDFAESFIIPLSLTGSKIMIKTQYQKGYVRYYLETAHTGNLTFTGLAVRIKQP